MSKYKELVYMILDELKITSDDSFFNEDHVIFLLSKWRPFLLKQRYNDIKKQIPESNYQTICLDLELVNAIDGYDCGGKTLRSVQKIPTTIPIGSINIYPENFYDGDITFISRERMKYVGFNKYQKNTIYASLGPDTKLYLKSNNPNYEYLTKLRLTGVFEDTEKASELECDKKGKNDNISQDKNSEEDTCDIMNKDFPIEEALIPPLMELVLKELRGPLYMPRDQENNSSDELSKMQMKQ